MLNPRTDGFTLLEAIVAIAVLGTLLGVGFVSMQRPAVQTYANDVRALMQQARFDAVKRNRPVLVRWDDDGRRFESALATIGNLCTPEELLGSTGAEEYGNLAVTFPEGEVSLLWLPNGQARNCSTLSSFPSLIAEVSDGRMTQDILVSVTGRVTIE